jgi:hypothetical protein
MFDYTGLQPAHEKALNAELLFCSFVIEHNLPISVTDHATKLFPKMFSDSTTAAKYASSRTKSTALIEMMASDTQTQLVQKLRHQPFTLATDGSNDDTSMYPLVVRFFSIEQKRVLSLLLSLPECKEASCTGKNIFDVLDNQLKKFAIPWKNCICFESDSASVMLGAHKGVAAYIRKMADNVYIQGCVCHLVHIAAERAAQKLSFGVEDLLIDIYYYFDKSTKRLKELKQFQVLCNVEVRKILKHSSTRWLSLGICLKRLLQQWEPLQEYLQNIAMPKKRPAPSY